MLCADARYAVIVMKTVANRHQMDIALVARLDRGGRWMRALLLTTLGSHRPRPALQLPVGDFTGRGGLCRRAIGRSCDRRSLQWRFAVIRLGYSNAVQKQT